MEENNTPTHPGAPPETPPESPPETPPGNTPPPPQEDSGYVSPNRTIMLILAYLSLLGLIPLLVEKEDQEVQWHAKNGLVITAAWIIIAIGLMILQMIPFVGQILGCLIGFALPIAGLIVFILCIIKALNGERFRLPVVSDYADKWQ